MTVECPFFDPIICGVEEWKVLVIKVAPSDIISSRYPVLLQELMLSFTSSPPAPTPPPPPALKSSQDCRREGKFIRPRQRRCWHIRLKISEDVPPPDVVHMVVLPSQSEFFATGECVISPPHSARHPVGQQHVYTIVAS